MEYLQIKFLYEELRYEEAIQSGEKMMREGRLYTPQSLELVHQFMALSYYNLGRTDSAKVHFLSLLSINPDKELNPIDTSPKIIEFFKKLKEEQRSSISSGQTTAAYRQYIFPEDRRPSAAWRSALVPGWGQYYKDQKKRGYLLGGLFAGSAISTITSAFLEEKYKTNYRESTDPQIIKEQYDLYNQWSKTRRISLYTSIALWAISFTDALWSPYVELSIADQTPENVSLSISFPIH